MKRLLGMTLLLTGLLIAAPARAQSAKTPEVLRKGLTALNRHFAELNRHVAARAALLERLERYRTLLRKTRALPAGPARDYRLRRLLAEARTLAKRLSGLDQRIRVVQKSLDDARRRLLSSLAQLKGAHRTRLRQELARTRRGRTHRVLRVAQPRIHPLDGPRQILDKADVLKDSEEKIRKRLAEIARVIGRLKNRRTLRNISRRVDRYTGLFNEDSSRRRVTRIRPAKVPAEAAAPQGTGDPSHNSQDSDGLASYGTSAPADDGTGEWGPGRSVSSGTYAVVLRELLTPATIQALRKAGRSGDPAARLKALERARRELTLAAQRLRERAKRYRQRARDLRATERRNRR